MITSRDYRTALSVLDEGDLYQIISMYQEALEFVIAEEIERGHPPPRWAYTHPLTRIYTERLMQLAGVGPGPAESWRTAYKFARLAATNCAANCVLCGTAYHFIPATAGRRGEYEDR